MQTSPEPLCNDRRDARAIALVVSAALAVSAAIAYALLRQAAAHGYDCYFIVPKLLRGERADARHPLALPVLDLLAGWLGDGPLHERLKLVGALTVAAAIGVTTYALWSWQRRLWPALRAGLLAACLPGVVHHATIAELHGPFLLGAAIAFWLAVASARCARSVVAGVMVGGGTALATALHASGHLLLPWLLVWVGLERHRRGLRPWTALVTAGVVHAVANTTLGVLVQRELQASAALQFVTGYRFATAVDVQLLVREWLWPFLPAALLFPSGLAASARARALVVAIAIGLPGYLVFAHWMLTLPTRGHVLHEFGAYMLPLGLVAAAALAFAVPARVWGVLVAVAVLGTVPRRLWPPRPVPDLTFGETALAALAEPGIRLLVGPAEYGGVFELACRPGNGVALPRLSELMDGEALVLEADRLGATRPEEVALWFHPQVSGRRWFATASGLQHLRAGGGKFAECVDRSLPAMYTLQPRVLAGAVAVDVVELVPKP